MLYLGKEQGVPGGVSIPLPRFGQGYFNSLTDNNRKYTDQVITFTWNSQLGKGEDSLLTAKFYADFLNTKFEMTLPASSQRRFSNQQDSYGVQVNHNWKFATN